MISQQQWDYTKRKAIPSPFPTLSVCTSNLKHSIATPLPRIQAPVCDSNRLLQLEGQYKLNIVATINSADHVIDTGALIRHSTH